MALPFLPAEHIADAFFQLEERAPPEAKPVLDYISNTWIRSTVFTISSWCVFMTPVRTNNDVEGWHNRLNAQVATRGPVPFYFLICELFSEAADIPLQLRLVAEGKLRRYQRKQTRQVQQMIFSLWQQYKDNTISASHLLRKCASVYGPPPQ